MSKAIFKFIFRMLIFAMAFYVVSEFVVACDIDTRVGIGSILAVIVIISTFIIINRTKFYRCGSCGITRFEKAPL